MILKIEVSGPLEAALKTQANEQGLSADQVAYRVLAQVLTPGLDGEAAGSVAPSWTTGEEKARAFLEWAESHRETPPLSDKAISRANLYPDRG